MITLVDWHYFDTPRSTTEEVMFKLYQRPSLDQIVTGLEQEPVITPRIVVNAYWVALSADMEAFGLGEYVDPAHIERLGTALAGAIRNAQER